ncbi:MAG: fliE [Myxococcaceae bacterium]|nr:fliE [Myxococcaceae bacterium]
MSMPIKPAGLPMPELQSSRNAAILKPGMAAPSIASPSVPGNAPVGGESPNTTDFSSTLRNVLAEANDKQVQAQNVADDYASGKQNDLHGTMITMTEADINLRLVSNVRNKVIDAYREVMRMGS